VNALETISEVRCHGGVQGVYRHMSAETGTEMAFAVFVPPHDASARLPVVWYLSGLTCTHANVMEKGEYRAACAELGLIFVAPDTSPRGEGVPDEPDGAYDFGLGAGFYVDATEPPYAQHYRMRSYIERELPALIGTHFPADLARQGITGHSMGGHGALTIGLRNPGKFRSVSAFSPIVAPTQCPWGEKALSGYMGHDRSTWSDYDACALIDAGARIPELLVDQGDADNFLESQLKTGLLQRLRPQLLLHLDLHGRSSALAFRTAAVMRRLGAILAGGGSSRFGSDKAALVINAKPLLEHVANALRPFVETIVVAGREWDGMQSVADRPAESLGPLGGLCGALAHARSQGFDGVISAGCDCLPLPVEALLNSHEPVILDQQPLIGWWPVRFAQGLEDWLGSPANRSVYRWADAAGAQRIAAPTAIYNLNTPADFDLWVAQGAPGA
jgi:S-formylglutathione hydrolase